jgi:hypothetical protein
MNFKFHSMRNTIRYHATILATALISSLAVEVCSAAEVYVAPQGNDSNPGTKDQPFKTLEKARDALRSSDRPDRIIIRGGIYRLSDTRIFLPFTRAG